MWYDTRNHPNVHLTVPQPDNKIGDGPEGPEVARMTKFLKNYWQGYSLKTIMPIGEHYKGSIPLGLRQELPIAIRQITSKGKKTIVFLENDWSLFISYSMTGHWEKQRNKHAWLKFTVVNPAGYTRDLYWTCPRTWGKVKFLQRPALEKEMSKLGFDIMTDSPTDEEILEVFPKRGVNICRFLMDQSRFCGIGNYIKAMILYQLELSPWIKTTDLTDEYKCLLFQKAQEIAQIALKARGMGMRDYKDENGVTVGVAFDVTPYNKKTDSYGNPVKKERTPDGRMTHWVPAVQALI